MVSFQLITVSGIILSCIKFVIFFPKLFINNGIPEFHQWILLETKSCFKSWTNQKIYSPAYLSWCRFNRLPINFTGYLGTKKLLKWYKSQKNLVLFIIFLMILVPSNFILCLKKVVPCKNYITLHKFFNKGVIS